MPACTMGFDGLPGLSMFNGGWVSSSPATSGDHDQEAGH